MAFELPPFSQSRFAASIAPLSPEALSRPAVDALFAHYCELARWNRRTNLIGRGTVGEILARHFGESLASLPLLPENVRVGLDLGSGAGFPGLVLAAARPGMGMTLVEARERKWAFLSSAARKASLPVRCLNVRVESPLPAGLPESIDVITSRALRLDVETWGALADRLAPEGRILLWVGEINPDLPPDLVHCGSVKLAGSERRRIEAFRRLARQPVGARSNIEP
jgi:16S rRNA (guanine527-N7)-methyltransferase